MLNIKLFVVYFFRPIWVHLKLSLFKVKWRHINPENLTEAAFFFPTEKVSVGKGSYGTLNVLTDFNKDSYLKIGNYCSIAENVFFMLDGGHDYKRCTTYPFPKLIYNMGIDATTKGPIIVEDDVWIGNGAMILSGVTLGKGCVIGARSVVTKDVLPYAIYVGYGVIKYRFAKNIIDALIKIDFSQVDDLVLKNYKPYCKTEVHEKNVSEIIKAFRAQDNNMEDDINGI